MTRRSLLVRVLAGWIALLPALGQEGDVLEPLRAVPRMRSPSAQLEHARRIKAARRGQPPRERERRTEQAIAAYRAVRQYFPWATRIGSEAAFRAGELLSAAGRMHEARIELELAVRSGEGTPFRARAGLALGRLLRRGGDLQAAYRAFLDVVADPGTARGSRDQAWLWIGRVRAQEGRMEDARSAWREVTKHALDPLDRIRAYDSIGMSWLERGDPEAAAGVLNECLRELSGPALEVTRSGAKVRRALARMRVVRRLQREIESRMRSRQIEGTPRKR